MKNDMPFLFTVKPIDEGRAVTMQEAEVLTLKWGHGCRIWKSATRGL
jgi:hypothetical protein